MINIKYCVQFLKVALKECSKENPRRGGIGASFLLGHAGVYAVSALVYNSLGNPASLVCTFIIIGLHNFFGC